MEAQVSFCWTVYGVQVREDGTQSVPDVGKALQ